MEPTISPSVRHTLVSAADGVPLNVVEAGSGDGSADGVLLIHGSNQSHICWKRQLESDLAQHLHLVALDLRGHGNSGKPWTRDSYQRTEIWADDISRVMDATVLKRPLLVAWSFGGWIAMHYIRHFGIDRLAGLVLVATRAGIVPMPPPRSGVSSAMGGFTDGYMGQNMAAAQAFTDRLVADPADPDWQPSALASALCVPPYVRAAMRPPLLLADDQPLVNNEDLADSLDLPVQLVFGGRDGLMDSAAVAAEFAERLPRAAARIHSQAGHAVFFEAAAAFNSDLLALAREQHGLELS